MSMLHVWKLLASEAGLNSEAADTTGSYLIKAYSEECRYYHNLEHITQVLEKLEEVREHLPVEDGEPLQNLKFALWFHDVVCIPGASDNEVVSANIALSRLQLCGMSKSRASHIARLIMATDHNELSVEDQELQIRDIDLSILVENPETYARYAQSIRREYEGVNDLMYKRGRTHFLQKMLGREQSGTLFGTAYFSKFRHIARQNMTWEIDTL
jgi:predicted metal-dependent HD superfamily phosphohydrolase